MVTFTLVIAALGGLGIALIFYALATPQAVIRHAQTVAQEDRIRGNEWLTGPAYALAARWSRKDDSIERQLRAANWFWAPGEPTSPDSHAPFHTVPGYRAAVLYSAMAYGAGGLIGGTPLTLAADLPIGIALGLALLATGLGYTAPGSRLAAAVRERQHRLVIEMAFRLPELAAIVSTGKSLPQACRTLIERPGGPFITELARLLRIYDTTMSLALAVEAVIAHNHFPPLTEFFRQMLLVEQQGGAVGPALQIQAEAAQNTLQRRLLEQGLQNTGVMELPVVAGSMVVTMILIGGPAVYLLLTYL